ncbi:MAG: ABC transporter ATP-binding protein [Deltaproteobacteria bacterium]|nr:MAG: ABC transporter ATP-binding protein [Deltaproteobacteria bacterium]
MTAARPTLSVRDVGHRYAKAERPALRDVSFSVDPGERVGLLGPNGAGKSTLMRLCCGVLALQRGSIEVCGFDVRHDRLEARARIGYLPETAPLPPELKVVEYLRFRARLRGLSRPAEAAAEVLDRTATGHVADRLIGHLSRGYRQRVGLADALLGDPPLLILDEPTVGLDPVQIEQVRSLVVGLAEDRAVVFSSHILAEVAAVCDRVVILADGRLVADEPVEAGTDVDVRWDREPGEALDAIARTADARVVDAGPVPHGGYRATLRVAPGGASACAEAVGRASFAAGLTVLELSPRRSALEDRFLEAVEGGR